MGISTAGIGSGLDVNAIVSSLMGAEQKPLTAITKQKISLDAKLTAFGTIKSSLAVFQNALKSLSSPLKFNAQTANFAEASVLKATANGKAAAGVYAVNVTQLAQAAKVASKGFTSTAEAVGSGELIIELGTYTNATNSFSPNPTKAPVTIKIDGTNNTLAGVRDAINAGNAGVSASIVNDGSASGNRLVITSKETGEINSVKITVNDTGDGNNTDTLGLSALAFNPTAALGVGKNLTLVQEAKDATLTIDGISVKKSSNTVTDAIEGVTLNLLKVGTSASNLTIARDDSAAKFAIADLVKTYNDLSVTVKTLSKFDQANGGKNNGPLIGDATARSILVEIKEALTGTYGATGINTLSQIGIAFQKDGSLALDNAKLTAALEADTSAVAKLFTSSGRTTDPLVSFIGSTSKTITGKYDINVTQIATQGALTGSVAPNLTIKTGVNDVIKFNASGKDYTLKLTAGSYANADALIAELQTRILEAGAPVKASNSAPVKLVVNEFVRLTLDEPGSSGTIVIAAGTGGSDLFGSPTFANGVNVAGTINGAPATGFGQNLKSNTGNRAEGIELKIQGTATGARGSVEVNSGFGFEVSRIVDRFLNDDGLIKSKTSGIETSVKTLTKQQEALNTRLIAIESRYRKQFTTLDKMISQLSTTSSFLSQQLAGLQRSA